MKKNQFLLLKLMEECAEVIQRAAKQIQFGKDEVQKDREESNQQRLKGELLDLVSVAILLINDGEIPQWSHGELVDAALVKTAKMQRYLKLSADLGQLPEITL